MMVDAGIPQVKLSYLTSASPLPSQARKRKRGRFLVLSREQPAPPNKFPTSMAADTVEYGQRKTGQRDEGLVTAARILVTKFAVACAGIAVAAIMTMSGYVPMEAVQAPATVAALRFGASLLPGIIMALGVAFILLNPLTEKKHAELTADLNTDLPTN